MAFAGDHTIEQLSSYQVRQATYALSIRMRFDGFVFVYVQKIQCYVFVAELDGCCVILFTGPVTSPNFNV